MSAPSFLKHPTRATPARRLALQITAQVRKRNAFAHKLIESKVRHADIPQNERDFATLLILGVVATYGELDYLIDRALPKGTIKADVRDALRISTYELFFLNKEVPVVVDQGVELVRSLVPGAAGFANKVLHETAKLIPEFPFGDPSSDPQALAHQQAFPLWLTERLITDLGYDKAKLFMEASNQQAPIFIVDLQQGTTLKIVSAQLKDYIPRIEAGEMIVADASTQSVTDYATPSSDGPYLEVGSGRGTKTILLLKNAQRMHQFKPQLYAVDIHAFKHDILKQRARAYGLDNVTTILGDATRLDTLATASILPESFDGALIDAPCSGTGTMRRHPEIRWRLTPKTVTTLAQQGLAMLSSASSHIKKGGFIVYSTCSALHEENECVLENFLASENGKGFSVIEPPFCSSLSPGSPDVHFATKLVRQR